MELYIIKEYLVKDGRRGAEGLLFIAKAGKTCLTIKIIYNTVYINMDIDPFDKLTDVKYSPKIKYDSVFDFFKSIYSKCTSDAITIIDPKSLLLPILVLETLVNIKNKPLIFHYKSISSDGLLIFVPSQEKKIVVTFQLACRYPSTFLISELMKQNQLRFSIAKSMRKGANYLIQLYKIRQIY